MHDRCIERSHMAVYQRAAMHNCQLHTFQKKKWKIFELLLKFVFKKKKKTLLKKLFVLLEICLALARMRYRRARKPATATLAVPPQLAAKMRQCTMMTENWFYTIHVFEKN